MNVREALMTLAALLLPVLILLCKLLLRRRSTSSTSNFNPEPSESRHIADSSASVSDSDASLPLPTGEYEVFLSFRGPDTQNEITDVLYRFLIRSKIRTFKHDEDLRVGEGIWPSLVEAMAESKIYVPIFSENYARSEWCLKELAKMVEFRKQDKRHIILPIFYKVNPGDVRKHIGAYEQAFKQHEKNFDDKTIQSWKDALKEVGELKGWHVTDNDGQGAIADEVFENIWSHLSKNYVLVTDELVGIDEHLKAVVERLELNSKAVKMVGIHGIGGIGKTTVATAVYNQICDRFDRHCFVEDVRETLQQRDGITALQNKLISSIVGKATPVSNVSEGIRLIRDRVSQYKVLIVLDDVDDKFKFDGILGKSGNFVSGSRFVVTSRNIKVLNLLEGCQLYEVGEMSYEHSFELFCKHAFRKDSAPHDYATLSRDIVSTTGGLPLTIKVVGSLLFKEDKAVWKEKLSRLKEIPEKEVLERLKISYDGLEYEAKQIFLDIACFYVGTDKEIASYMWSDCKLYPISTINVLIQRSMIKVGDNNKFKMHDQLRDLGKAIIREEDIEHPWLRSRIWSDEDALELLHGKKGTDKVKALQVHSDPRHYLTNEHFRNLSDLRYLRGSFVDLTGDFGDLQDLRWLRMENCRGSGDGITNFQMNKLVILDLMRSGITDDWGGWYHIKMAKKLKVLDLSYCGSITKLPDLSAYANLEHLNLCRLGRTGSNNQDLNIGKLTNLKVLNLESCRIRRIVGGRIGMLQGLRELYISSCSCDNLGQFLADIATLPSLKIFTATGVELKAALELPKSLKELHALFSSVANLEDLSDLEILRVQSLADVRLNWSKLSKLKLLLLYKSSITTMGPHLFPPSLTELRVSNFPMLETLPNLENLGNLTLLSVFECRKLRQIQGLGGGMKSLRSLNIFSAESLMHLDGLENLPSLINVELESCNAIEQLLPITSNNNLAALSRLSKVKIMFCPRLAEIFRGLDDEDVNGQTIVLDSLRDLEVARCESLQVEGLPCLSKFPGLTKLRLWDLKGMVKLEGLDSLEQLQSLQLRGMPSVDRLPCLSKLRKLAFLELQQMLNLREFEGLEELKSLLRLELRGCTSLERLLTSALEELQELIIMGCTSLENFCITGCSKLANLYISGCPKVHAVQGLGGGLTSLRHLSAESLIHLDGLENLPTLTDLHLRSCDAMERLLPIMNPAGLNKLRTVEIVKCPHLKEIFHGLDHDDGLELYSLEQLEVNGCPSLESLPHLSRLPSLRKLKLMDAKGMVKINGLESLQQLQVLVLTDLPGLLGVDGLEDLNSLEQLALSGCMLERLLPVRNPAGLNQLRTLELLKCPRLKEIFYGLDHEDGLVLYSLEHLEVNGCTSLESLPHLSMFPSLRKLKLMDAKGIVKLNGLESLQQLQVLVLTDLPGLLDVNGLEDLNSLERLALAGCTLLERLPDLSGLKNLNWLIFTGCTSLESLPDLSCLKNLEKLDLRGCSKVTDLSGLHKLQGVEIQWPDGQVPEWSSDSKPHSEPQRLSYPSMY